MKALQSLDRKYIWSVTPYEILTHERPVPVMLPALILTAACGPNSHVWPSLAARRPSAKGKARGRGRGLMPGYIGRGRGGGRRGRGRGRGRGSAAPIEDAGMLAIEDGGAHEPHEAAGDASDASLESDEADKPESGASTSTEDSEEAPATDEHERNEEKDEELSWVSNGSA